MSSDSDNLSAELPFCLHLLFGALMGTAVMLLYSSYPQATVALLSGLCAVSWFEARKATREWSAVCRLLEGCKNE
jgi:hypothetical protein